MADTKRVVVTGATGHVGRKLCKRLIAMGYQVVVFSRDPQKARQVVAGASEYVAWQVAESGPWASAVDGAYGVIHLAAASLFERRWSAAYKREIFESRRIGTRGLVNAIGQARNRPQAFICISGVNYYGPHGDEKLDESAPPGHDFLARVCVEAWEQEANRAAELGVRTTILRSGVVIGSDETKRGLPIDLRHASLARPGVILKTDEGAFPLLTLPFLFFAGGPILPGTQWLSWIHIEDLVGLLIMALEDERMHGPINATAPAPQTYRDFAKSIGLAMGRPSWLPMPGFAMKLLLGEMANMITTGQRVVPKKALDLGYKFKYPHSDQAIRQALGSS